MSAIQDELIKATRFNWDASATRSRNIEQLCRQTNSLEDPDYEKLSVESRKFIDDVITALEEKTDIPEFPDYQSEPEPEPEPDAAPRKRRRPAAAKKEEPAAAADAPAEEADAPAEEKAPRKRARKPKEPKAPKEPKVDENGFKRGERMNLFRRLVLENPDMKKADLVALSESKGNTVTPSTAAMVQYNITNALRVLKDMGLYDHWEALKSYKPE